MNSDKLLMARLRRYEHRTMDEGADRIQRLLAENEMLREELVKHQSKGYARMACSFAAQIFSLREVLASSKSWIERWTKHVGNCSGSDETCTCGRAAILFEARAALAEGEKEP